MAKSRTPGIAILASGSGSTAEAFIHATQDGRVAAEVGVVVCNNTPANAGVYDRIRKLNTQYGLGIEIAHVSAVTHPKGNVGPGQTLAESEAIARIAKDYRLVHIALMGYMKTVRGALIDEFGWHSDFSHPLQASMTNTHPGPLPETAGTYGVHASERVLNLGMTVSRHTVHMVAEGVDEGPIIAEHAVGVLDGDTAESLFDRVQIEEKLQLPLVLDRFLQEQEAIRVAAKAKAV